MWEGILSFITNYLPGILIGLLILMFLVVAHEFGHFILARKNGVKVNEFGIGFPPRAIAWQKGKDGKWHKLPKSKWPKPNETTKSLVLSLNWLPIGGFCAMDGESDADTKKGTFGAASFKSKTKILFGGVMMNWIVAFIIFTILAFIGMPQFIDNQFNLPIDAEKDLIPVVVTGVVENSPAEKSGIIAGDIITKINGETISVEDDFFSFNKQHAGEKVQYEIIRDDEIITVESMLNDENADYRLGVATYSKMTIRSTWSAPIVGAVTTVQLTGETFRGLATMVGNLFYGALNIASEEGRETIGEVGDQVSGPIGIIGYYFPIILGSGLPMLVLFAAIISVSLACMNVLPIPALDGGRWFLILIYKLRKKKLTKEIEEKIVSRAFLVLIILMIIVTILDITKFF